MGHQVLSGKRVSRIDSVSPDKTEWTPEGFLIDTPIVTTIGVFEYKNPDGSVRRELRLPEHVFDEDSLATYEGKPVIITHAARRVDKTNVADEIVGTMLSKGYKDGDSVRTRVAIHDIDTVKRSGLRELSLGYDLVLDETPGEWQGKPYDAIQTKITINHLALVHDARAGDDARLNLDSKNETLKGVMEMAKGTKKPMNGDQLAAALEAKRGRRADSAELAIIKEIAELDDTPVLDAETSPAEADVKKADASAKSVEDKIKAIKEKHDGRKDAAPPKADTLPGIVKQQDADIDDLLDIIEALQAKADFDSSADSDGAKDKDDEPKINMDSADAVDALVRERLQLARLGDRLNLDGLEVMKPIDAKKTIVKTVNPNMRLDGKSAVYVQAAFDQAVEQINTSKDVDYQRRQMSGRMDGKMPDMAHDKPAADTARERMVERMMNGGNE